MNNEGVREPGRAAGLASTLANVRRILFAVLLLAFVGTLVELFLLGHDEDRWQIVPLVLLGAGTVSLAWTAIRPSAPAVRVFQVVMALFIAAGAIGLVQHYRANMEFQLEMDPSLRAMALFWKVMAAKAPPALAPAIMAQLGVIGMAYAYRHPAQAPAVMSEHEEGEREDAIR